jgi:tetratricopeptide (TPR) repeat protein
VESQCKTILNIDENYTPAMNRLAWTYARQGINLKEAEELSLNSMKYDPEIPEYLDTLSEIYYQMEDYEKAVQLIKKAITLRPSDPYFQRQLQKFETASREEAAIS